MPTGVTLTTLKNSLKLHGLMSPWLWAIIFLLASALSLLIPPMQSPDEMSHITRAYLISKGQFLLAPPTPALREFAKKYADNQAVDGFVERTLSNGGRTGGMVDQGLMRYTDLYADLYGVQPGQPARAFTQAVDDQAAAIEWGGGDEYYVMPGTGYYFPLIYTPQAAGLLIGRIAGLSVEWSYRLARGLTLLLCLLLLRAAFIRRTPSVLTLAVLLLPMSMFQMLSPTLDGLTTAIAILTISLFLTAWQVPPDLKKSAALAVCIFLLVTSRSQLMPLLILPFCLALRHRSRRELYWGLVVTAAAIAWTLFALVSTNDTRVERSHTSLELLIHYFQHPFAFLQIVFDSVTDPVLFTFYHQSFIGILAMLDTPLRDNFYPVLWLGLLVCFVVSSAPLKNWTDMPARAVLAFASGASALMIFLALLVTWTPHPASLIIGVQGRYFVVPVILLSYALAADPAGLNVPQRRVLAGVFVTFASVSLYALISTLLGRYP